MERCDYCRQYITDTPVYLTRQTAKATMLSPGETEDQPFHTECADRVQSPDYAAWCEEQASLRGYSDEERERI